MPLSLGNTPTADAYPAPGAGGAQLAGSDIFTSGWFIVANNAVFAEYEFGNQGQLRTSGELYLAPGNYPLIASVENKLCGIRFRSAVAGTPAQVWGTLFYPTDPTLQSSSEFTAAVSPSGGISGGGGTSVLAKATGIVDDSNSIAETALLSQVIAGGAMGSSGILRVSIYGDYLNNSGANRTLRFRILFGGVVLHDDNPGAGILTSATRRGWFSQFHIANLGATNSQSFNGFSGLGAIIASDNYNVVSHVGGATTFGTADNSTYSILNAGGNPSAIDTTIPQTLQFLATNDLAAVTVSCRRMFWVIELL
jgi:hypothetical protein